MKLTKGLLFLSFTLITLVLTPQVLAKQEIRVKIEEKKTERLEKLSAIRRERIMSYSNKMIVRLEATVERFEKLITRIEKRDVSEIKTSLNEAKQKLTLVKSNVATLKDSLSSMTTVEDPKAEFEKVRETLKGIKNDFKEVHSKLVKLVGDIKGLRVGENKND